ncbi:choice-of-anchor L domain-containing protein [Flavobacterium sp.]|uniref:choice-of-anchor L domain-containing protein n=1 Tax=Flavobacterium sp. TaxID=239 RepID=UPI002615D96C|nr:choice-of-anchor L domain-containing protein [Flavobacterium sp.]
MKKLLLFSTLLFAATIFAQNTCEDALNIPVNDGLICNSSAEASFNLSSPPTIEACNPLTPSNAAIWFEFIATHTRLKLNLQQLPGTSANIAAHLFSGNCDNLDAIGCLSSSGIMNNLIVGEPYKIELTTNVTTPSVSLCIIVPPAGVTANATDYTPEELVTDVLINSSCVIVSNITYSTGPTDTDGGLGSFTSNGADFIFDEGIVLSTGKVSNVQGPDNGITSQDTESGNDTDLAEIMNMNGLNGDFFNSTSLEFDFVPMIEEISFDFLFASNEYGIFQCIYGDAFAFILTDLTTGVSTNLAVIPGTAVPVSVVTIRNSQYNTNCASANAAYFDNFYESSDPTAPVNFNGTTVPMTAYSEVVPGNPYHIKLVIADYMDKVMDSAVFIEAGSFNIGSPESGELTAENGTILCEGGSTMLNINLPDSFTFTWHLNGELIPSETSSTYYAIQAGEYTVNVAFEGSACSLDYTINIFEEGIQPIPVIISDYIIFEPESDGVFTFNLDSKTQQIINSINAGEPLVTLHNTQDDAMNGTNALPGIYNNTTNPETLFVRIENPQTGCFTTGSFQIVVLDENYTTPAPQGDESQSFEEGDTLADIEVEGENIQWYENDATGGRSTQDNTDDEEPLPLNTLLVDGTTYYASQTIWGIESEERLAVTVYLSMSAEQQVFTGFKAYPNPVKDMLYLQNNTAIESISVINLLGQEVLSQAINKETATINLQDLANGIYLVKVKAQQSEKTIKIIKE